MTAVFCIACGSSSCLHLQESRKTLLTKREISIVRALAVPQAGTLKLVAFQLGISPATIKVYVSKLYDKLGWAGGNIPNLVLWAIAHREALGISLPTPEQFPALAG